MIDVWGQGKRHDRMHEDSPDLFFEHPDRTPQIVEAEDLRTGGPTALGRSPDLRYLRRT